MNMENRRKIVSLLGSMPVWGWPRGSATMYLLDGAFIVVKYVNMSRDRPHLLDFVDQSITDQNEEV